MGTGHDLHALVPEDLCGLLRKLPLAGFCKSHHVGNDYKGEAGTLHRVKEDLRGPPRTACDNDSLEPEFLRPFDGEVCCILCVYRARFIEIVAGFCDKGHKYLLISSHEKLCQILVMTISDQPDGSGTAIRRYQK